jgi:hypothetical protein
MSSEMNMNGREPMGLGALIRAGADGELTPQQERRLEVHLEREPGDASRIESERLLREAVSRIGQSGPGAPAGLREQVLRAMAAADLSADGAAVDVSGPDVPGRMAPLTRSRSFWASASGRTALVAAALLMAVTAGFLVRGSLPADGVFSARTTAVQFVAREHGRCTVEIAPGADKFAVTDPLMLPSFARTLMGRDVSLGDLVEGGATNLRFIDAGGCHVPMGGRSMHLRFEAPTPSGGTTLASLFVQEDRGELDLAESVTYRLDPRAESGEASRSPGVFLWLRDGMVYYLVTEAPEGCEDMRRCLDAPAAVRPLNDAA